MPPCSESDDVMPLSAVRARRKMRGPRAREREGGTFAVYVAWCNYGARGLGCLSESAGSCGYRLPRLAVAPAACGWLRVSLSACEYKRDFFFEV
jgi:hypothetical protein